MTNKYIEKIAAELKGVSKITSPQPGGVLGTHTPGHTQTYGSMAGGSHLYDAGGGGTFPPSPASNSSTHLKTPTAPRHIGDVSNDVEKVAAVFKEAPNQNEKDARKVLHTYGVVAGGGAAGLGAKTVHDQYHGGHLTGRETLYHGTAHSTKANILDKGLSPGSRTMSAKIIEDMHKEPGSLGSDRLSFMTRSKTQGRQYSYLGELADSGGVEGLQQHLKSHSKDTFTEKDVRKRALRLKDDSNTLKINAPTWKKDKFNIVENPEASRLKGSNIYKALNGMTDKSIDAEFKKHVVNEGPVGPEHFVKSKHYKPNSSGEILDYISKNKTRFGKGIGKTIGGIGLAVAGVAAVKHQRNEIKKLAEIREDLTGIPRLKRKKGNTAKAAVAEALDKTMINDMRI